MNPVTRVELDVIRNRQTAIANEMAALARQVERLIQRCEAEVVPEQQPAPVPAAKILAESRRPIVVDVEIPAPLPKQPPPLEPLPILPSGPPAPAVEKDSLEMQLGTVWLVRVGIVILLTGLVFLGNYAYQTWVIHHGPAGKIAMLLLCGGALFGVGAWLEKTREEMGNYARVLMAGGLATGYYTFYAAHFVEKLRVIESPVLGGALLLAFAGGIVWFANRKRSETIAMLAVLLSYYTSAINPIGTFTLFSALLLTAVAVYFVARHGWARLTSAALFATYASYAYWRFVHGASPVPAWTGPAFLSGYWALFTAAVFITRTAPPMSRAVFATLNNGAFFTYASLSMIAHQPDRYWAFTVAFGGTLLALGTFARRREMENLALDGTFFAQGALLVTAGLIMKLTGPQMAIVLAVESVLFGFVSHKRHAWLLDIAAVLSAVGAVLFATVALIDKQAHSLPVALTVCAAHVFSAWHTKQRLALLNPARFSGGGAFRILLAAVLGAFAVYAHAAPQNQSPILAATAIVCMASVHLIGIAELPVATLGFLSLALASLLLQPFHEGRALGLLGCGIAAAAWWQHQRRVEIRPYSRLFSEFSNAAIAVGVSFYWLYTQHEIAARQTLAPAVVLAFAIIGLAIRSPGVFIAGQIPLLLGIAAFFDRLDRGDSWLPPLAVPGAFAALAVLTRLRRFPWDSIIPWQVIAQAQGVGALAFTGIWAMYYVPEQWRAVFFAAVSCGLFAGSLRRADFYIPAAACAGIALLLLVILPPVAQGWLALALCIVGFELTRSASEQGRIAAKSFPRILAIAMAVVGLQLGTRLTYEKHSNLLTVFWAIFALTILILGIVRRERVYRRAGLGVLGLAVGAVFFVDVWRLGTFERITAFLVLGAVLILLGFFYNRFRDFIRKWI